MAMAGTREPLRDPDSVIVQAVYIGEPWCSEWQCCALADPQANDDADFKNPPLISPTCSAVLLHDLSHCRCLSSYGFPCDNTSCCQA